MVPGSIKAHTREEHTKQSQVNLGAAPGSIKTAPRSKIKQEVGSSQEDMASQRVLSPYLGLEALLAAPDRMAL